MATSSRRRGPSKVTEGLSDVPHVPIARLCAMAYRSLVDRLHERLAKRGVRMRPAYAFVLLAARHEAIGIGDIGELLGMTKQAASKLVDALESEGYARRVASEHDGRAWRVEVTSRGQRVLEIVERIYAELEAEWASAIGRARVEALRADLTTILRAQNGGQLPPVRPTW